MLNRLQKGFIGDDQIDGFKILIGNSESLRFKRSNGSIVDVFKVNALDKFEFSESVYVGSDKLATVTEVDSKVLVETQRALAAEAALGVMVQGVEFSLQQEISRAMLAEAAISEMLSNEIERSTGKDEEHDSEIEQLGLDLEALELTTAGIRPDLTTETFERQAADTILSNAISAVSASVSQEILDRQAGDVSVLNQSKSYTDQKIFDLVGMAPAAYDTLKEIADYIALDQTGTVAILSELAEHELRLGALEAVQSPISEKYRKTLDATDIANGYVELPFVSLANTVNAYIGRLAIHEGVVEDYTLSVVNGKTRLTFVNTVAFGGLESIAEGYNFYATFMR